MDYSKVHRVLLFIVVSFAVIAAVIGLAMAGILLQVSAAMVAVALFWIAWELRRLFDFLRELVEEYAQAFIEGYQQALAARQGN